MNPSSSAQINQRKQDHINAILKDTDIERHAAGFESIALQHRGLPELNFSEVDTSTVFLEKTLSFPLLISSMTGGAAQNLERINHHLAEAAEAKKIALAVGSQRAMLVDAKAASSFNIRPLCPNIPLMANIGAVQLNKGLGHTDIQKAIDHLQADALYLHLNPLQEVIQPEGDTDFAQLADKIAHLQQALDIPIILKEVGCGLSAADIQLGLKSGITRFDLAGRGGTSWSRIEAHRSDNPLGILFQDWGLTTVEALKQARPFQSQAQFIASGGIRNGIDMVKSVIMGGQLCGVAAPFLEAAITSTEAVIAKIDQFEQAFKTAQFLLGAATIDDLFLNDALLQRPNHKD